MKTPLAIAVVCVDWRMHHPQSNFIEKLYEYLDTEKIYLITYPGVDGLAKEKHSAQRALFENTVQRTREVLREHGATAVPKVLVVHSECAGHPVPDGQHCVDGKAVTAKLNEELGLERPFDLLLAKKQDSDFTWEIREL